MARLAEAPGRKQRKLELGLGAKWRKERLV